MPEIKKCGAFIVDSNFNEEKFLEHSINELRIFLYNELAHIDEIKDITLQLVCMFSLIDQLAQEQANYPQGKGTAEAFKQFVLKHQKQCDYMDSVEPVTLYYRVEDAIDEASILPGFPLEKEVSLESLGNLDSVLVKDIIFSKKSFEILDYIKRKKGDKFANQKKNEHKFVSVLYRMRNKAVHEMSGLGETKNIKDESNYAEPFYRDVGRIYRIDDDTVMDDVVELVVPNIFVRNILVDCIEGYLEDCIINNHFPFSNNEMTRKCRLSWYDI